MGSYIWNHPGDFAGSLVDWKDLSSGNYAKWAGHIAPSVAITLATVGGGGAIAKGAEAAGLAVRGAEAVTEAGGAAADAVGEAGIATARAGVATAAREAGEGAAGWAANLERAGAEAGSGVGESGASQSASRVVFSGHGGYEPGSGMLTVPKGTSVSTYAPHGGSITDATGNAIELGHPATPFRTYSPGEQMPNYTLYPPEGLRIEGSPITVGSPTRLSDLLRPGMGECHWAACLTGPPI